MTFNDFKFDPRLAQIIADQGFTDPTPIQMQAIPPILAGKDVAGLAQTGTGKTAAYLLPLINRWLVTGADADDKDSASDLNTVPFSDWQQRNMVLVLVPTRELAEQVLKTAELFGQSLNFKSVAIYGGTSSDPQRKAMAEGRQLVIATPGRLIDLHKEHIVDLAQVRAVVFDEADRMFDMGFQDDVAYILRRIPSTRQYLMFSATLNFEVLKVAYQFGSEPVEISIDRDQPTADNVKHSILHVGTFEKPKFLLSVLKKQTARQIIIFSNFKHSIDALTQFLNSNGHQAVGISSLMSQAQRFRVMNQFRAENEKNILVATDVAARGLDIKGVDLVINYDLPDDAENYVHRIGRTGRAGHSGIAKSLVSDKDVEALSRIEEYLKAKVDVDWLDDADLVKDFVEYRSHSSSQPRFRNDHAGRPNQRNRNRRPGSGPQRSGRGHSRDQQDQRSRGDSAPQRGRGERPATQGKAGEARGRGPSNEKNRSQQQSARGGNYPRKSSHSRQASPHSARNGQAQRRDGASKPAANKSRPVSKPTLPAKASIGSTVSSFFKKLFS